MDRFSLLAVEAVGIGEALAEGQGMNQIGISAQQINVGYTMRQHPVRAHHRELRSGDVRVVVPGPGPSGLFTPSRVQRTVLTPQENSVSIAAIFVPAWPRLYRHCP